MFFLELVSALFEKLRPKGGANRGRSRTRAVGDKAEDFALVFLRQKCRFRVIDRNMQDEEGELDLVGRIRGNEGLVVVEVRSRKEGGLITPREAVDIHKQRQVVETAQRILRRKGYHDVLRFDVVGVYLNESGEPIKAEHFPDAFDRAVLRRR
ncbi:MAG: YraN family protein [Planctomycetes bacterium]|nr:YraN family protein [Planctomycetota bacterium]